ncbi:MAG: M1 family metallopeptidase [Flavobacteriaceae bacterium]|nr:M1 family metallopeptidase [Flavobacteriaceae bacterium]
MKLTRILNPVFLFLFFPLLFGQQEDDKLEEGHINDNKFKQLYEEFSTPNRYRTASGAPGDEYYQQKVDYKMDIELDEKNNILYGKQTITYSNNSPDDLSYLWIQLDQNIRKKDAPALEKNPSSAPNLKQVSSFVKDVLLESFDGGFEIEYVRDINGKPLRNIINNTMMLIDLDSPIKSGQKFLFSIKWKYSINNHVTKRGRSGYEFFPDDGNKAYVIAQFFPRLAVYNDVEGWQNYQFWGNGEFALNFGDYEVNITVPSDHIMEATGELQNPKEVLSKLEFRRYKEALNEFEVPVMIVTQEEVEEKEKVTSNNKKTWKFIANNVRDFAFATSRKFIWDMMVVPFKDRKVIAASLYPKEGNPLWEEFSTPVVAQTLKTYSKFTFDYPYPKAVSVHAKNQGMEYPMICWNYGRPEKDGSYSDRVKYGMISVIIHEVGHNYFPMIVNSDERQWGWMDEGLDTFVQYLTEQEFMKNYPSRRGPAKKIIPYMSGNQDFIAPIMSNPENVYQLGPNAYGKPAAALNILRETVMGSELFDYAFKKYAQRWMFKHPTPEDFFRTMEDASGVDLDWFWRGWFYSTDVVDIGIKNFKRFYISSEPGEIVKNEFKSFNVSPNEIAPVVFMISEEDSLFNKDLKNLNPIESSNDLKQYLNENFPEEKNNQIKKGNFFYEIEFEKPGGLVMPVIVEFTYSDGSKEVVNYPVQVWRKNDKLFKKLIVSEKEIINVTLDPNEETADVNLNNNNWPKKELPSKFDIFKSKIRG